MDSLLKAVTALKLSTDEIQWVIGQSFRESLQDIVFGSQQIHDLGILHTPVSRYSQNARIEEAASINFEQYLKSFVYPQRSLPGTSENDFIIETTISSISEILKTNSRIFVIHNADDIFLENHDFTYLQFIFGSRLTVYPYGGHLGNIWMKQNQKDMLSLIR